MRVPRSLRAAALIAAAALLALLTVEGSYALWNTATSGAPGTVQAASFTVNLTGTPSGQATPMTQANGQPASLALTIQTASLTPGTASYAGVLVANASDAGGTFSIDVTAGAPTVANQGSGTLKPYVSVRATTAADLSGCSTATGYAPLTTAGMTTAAVPKGGSTVVCFEVALSPTTPASAKGHAVSITVPLTAGQLCGVPSGCA